MTGILTDFTPKPLPDRSDKNAAIIDLNFSLMSQVVRSIRSSSIQTGSISPGSLPGGFGGFVVPTTKVGVSAVTGVANTAMRSDGAPAIDLAIVPTWTSVHTFSAASISRYSTIGSAIIRNANPALGDSSKPHILEVVNDGSTTDQLMSVSTYGDSATIASQNNFHWNRYRGSLASPSAILAGDIFMSMGFRGFDGISLSQSAAGFHCTATENFSTSHMGTMFDFQCTPTGTNTRNTVIQIDGTGIKSFGMIQASAAGSGSPSVRSYGVGDADAANNEGIIMIHGGGFADIGSFANGTGTYRPFRIKTNGIVGFLMDTSQAITMAGAVTVGSLSVSGTSKFTGNVGVGIPPSISSEFYIRNGSFGSSSGYGLDCAPLLTSGVTAFGGAGYFELRTDASSFTIASAYGIRIGSPTKGAGSTITGAYGLKIEDQTAGATNYAIKTGTGAVAFGDAVTIQNAGGANSYLNIASPVNAILTLSNGSSASEFDIFVQSSDLYITAGSSSDAVLTARQSSPGSGRTNIALFSSIGSFGGGVGVLYIRDSSTVPASNPTGGGILYSDSGALKWRGSSGTITTIAPA